MDAEGLGDQQILCEIPIQPMVATFLLRIRLMACLTMGAIDYIRLYERKSRLAVTNEYLRRNEETTNEKKVKKVRAMTDAK